MAAGTQRYIVRLVEGTTEETTHIVEQVVDADRIDVSNHFVAFFKEPKLNSNPAVCVLLIPILRVYSIALANDTLKESDGILKMPERK